MRASFLASSPIMSVAVGARVCQVANSGGELRRNRERRSSHSGHSAKFAYTEFSEVRALSWCSNVLSAIAHIHSPKTGVCCLRYVAKRPPRKGVGQKGEGAFGGNRSVD